MTRNRLSLLLAATALAALSVAPAGASSHRDAPLLTADPLADNTDTYAFISPDKPNTVTLIANYFPHDPAQGQFGVFDDTVFYELHIDTDGDGADNSTYGFDFRTGLRNADVTTPVTGPINELDDPDRQILQLYGVSRSTNGGAYTRLGANMLTPPPNYGANVIPNYDALVTQAVRNLADGVRAFAGPAADPYFGVDLAAARANGYNFATNGRNNYAGFNIATIAVEIPITLLTNGRTPSNASDPANVIGFWASARRPATRVLNPTGGSTASGDFVQVSRLGMPLVNELFIPLSQRNYYNASSPRQDSQWLRHIVVPQIAQDLGDGQFRRDGQPLTMNVPSGTRADLQAFYLQGLSELNRQLRTTPAEQLRLNLAIPPSAIPNRLGVLAGDRAGFPNGRRLIDDVNDITLRAVAGVLLNPSFDVPPNNTLGDGVDADDQPYRDTFPYMANPEAFHIGSS